MALDPTARLANIKDSIKKYFIDNLETAEGISVLFDTGLSEPSTIDRTLKRWITVDMGTIVLDTLSDIVINVYCCTRADNEGYKLAQLRDTVMGYLTVDPSDDSGDGTKRIDFYRSYPLPWTVIGGIVITSFFESADMDAPDESKYRVITVQMKAVAKV